MPSPEQLSLSEPQSTSPKDLEKPSTPINSPKIDKDPLRWHKIVSRTFGMDDPFDVMTPWEERIEDVWGPGSSL